MQYAHEFTHNDLESGCDDWFDHFSFFDSNMNMLEAGFLSSFDWPKQELLPLDTSENVELHMCSPEHSDAFLPCPPCDECFKVSRPALFKILSLGTSLYNMVFPNHENFSKVFPNNLITTKIPTNMEGDHFIGEIEMHMFSFVRNLVIRPNTFYFDIVMKLRMHYDEVVRTFSDTYWPTIYNSLYFSEDSVDVQNVVHHIAMMRIIALRICLIRLKTIMDSYKNVYAMHRKGECMTQQDALIMTQIEAKELTYIPLSSNYVCAPKIHKQNSFFSLIHIQ